LGTVKEERWWRTAEWHSDGFPGSADEKKKSSGRCAEISQQRRARSMPTTLCHRLTRRCSSERAFAQGEREKRKWCTSVATLFFFFSGSGFRDTKEHRKKRLALFLSFFEAPTENIGVPTTNLPVVSRDMRRRLSFWHVEAVFFYTSQFFCGLVVCILEKKEKMVTVFCVRSLEPHRRT
jgi:hypothetical protein